MNKIAKKSERFHNKVFWKINKNNIKVEKKNIKTYQPESH